VLQVICCRHLLLELYASCCWDSLFVRYWSLHALYLQVFISFMYMHLIFVTELYCHVPDKSVPSGFFLTLVCISFHLLTLCHRMVVVSYSPLHLLELVACHYRLSYHAYLREVGGDGSVLAWRRGAWDCSFFWVCCIIWFTMPIWGIGLASHSLLTASVWVCDTWFQLRGYAGL
jgi:hypothetical protein